MEIVTSAIGSLGATVKTCPDCGAALLEGTAGCQRIFEEILAREFGDFRYGRIHRMTVDAYSLQHPDKYMRSGKSFVAHLTGICAALERENARAINGSVQKWLSMNPEVDKPQHLPELRGALTITYVRGAADAEEHVKRVKEWAIDVWESWSEHHDLARRLIEKAESFKGGQR